MDRPVSPISKQLTRDVAPSAAFLPAEIEGNSVGEVNAIERQLATKEANDPNPCVDESDGLGGLSRSFSVWIVGATGCDEGADDNQCDGCGSDFHPRWVTGCDDYRNTRARRKLRLVDCV